MSSMAWSQGLRAWPYLSKHLKKVWLPGPLRTDAKTLLISSARRLEIPLSKCFLAPTAYRICAELLTGCEKMLLYVATGGTGGGGEKVSVIWVSGRDQKPNLKAVPSAEALGEDSTCWIRPCITSAAHCALGSPLGTVLYPSASGLYVHSRVSPVSQSCWPPLGLCLKTPAPSHPAFPVETHSEKLQEATW